MPEFAPNMPLEDVILFPLSTKGANYDSDMESLKGDYGDYSQSSNPMSRSIYDYENGISSPGTTVIQADGPAAGEKRGWTTLPRRPGDKINGSGPQKEYANGPSGPSLQTTPSKNGDKAGYYHVKQLLTDDSLYQDARLANEIANVRLKEEARLREERLREEQRHQLPLQPPNPEMYSPRQERTPVFMPSSRTSVNPRPVIAPKPNNITRLHDPETSRTDSPSSNGNSQSLLTGLRVNGSISPLPSKVSPSPAPLAKEENGNTDDLKDEEPTVVEETSALISSDGGVLRCPVSKVELRIPKGAIPDGEKHEIYVKVCREGDSPPIDKSKGETLLSPLVMCGPKGLSFLVPLELRLPHSGPVDPDGQWNFSLKAGEGGGKWNQLDLDVGKAAADGNFLSVPISRF